MRLSDEEVKHVANLARLYVDEKEYEKYGQELYAIIDEINKIKEINVDDDEMLISPTFNTDFMRNDIIGPSVKKEDIFKNVKNKSEDYIMVVNVIND